MTQQEKEKMVDEKKQLTSELADLEIKLEKADAQKRIAQAALVAIIGTMGLMLTPLVSAERIEALSAVTDVYFVGLVSIIAAYMGFTAWMSRK